MFRNRRNNVLWFGSRRLFSAKKIVLTQTKWRINGMKKVGIFMADGCEEIEGLTVVDIVRRAKLEMTTISITDKKEVTSSHNVTFLTDALASEVDFDGFDAIVLPGGMPGTLNLGASDMVNKVIKKFAGEGKIVAAICAAPSALGILGILEGKNATCYPGFEDQLKGAKFKAVPVVTDGNITTSRGMGTSILLGLELVKLLKDEETSKKLAEAIMMP